MTLKEAIENRDRLYKEYLREVILEVGFENCEGVSQEQCDNYCKEYLAPCDQCGTDQILKLLKEMPSQ